MRDNEALLIRVPDNQERSRYLVGLNIDDRFRWTKGAKPPLYGILELACINKRDYTVVVEEQSSS